MKPYGYIILGAIALLIFKAFFLDSYLKTNFPDANVSETNISEVNASIEQPQESSEAAAAAEGNVTAQTDKNATKAEEEKSLLEGLIDVIAEHLEKKLK